MTTIMNNQSNSISTKYSPIKLAHFNKKCKFIGSVLNDLIEQLFSNKDVTEILKSLSNKICNVLNDNFSSEDFIRTNIAGTDYTSYPFFMNILLIV